MTHTPGAVAASFRKHPAYQLVRHAAYLGKRGMPSKAELDALGFSPSRRAQVAADCAEVAEIHDTGEHATAWARGDGKSVV